MKKKAYQSPILETFVIASHGVIAVSLTGSTEGMETHSFLELPTEDNNGVDYEW